MLEARSVALVGASARLGSFGFRMVSEVARSKAPLELHLVNPRYDAVLGHRCLPSLDDVPGPVDLVLLGVRDSAVEAELERAARRGDRSAVIFGSAHEQGDVAGPPLRERLATIARAADMALCGGGCMGFVNVVYGLRAIGYVEPEPLPEGPVALVTHSGSAFSALLRSQRRIGFTLAVSAGQELVTTTASYLDYALDLPGTQIVALLLETLREPDAFRAVLRRAAEREIPVIALTVGGSPTGRAMVAAHSGALAGEDGAWEALFDAYGVVRVRDLDEMADTLELFAAGRRAPLTAPGAGIASVHDSGAERALVVDVAEALGVPFAPISGATHDRLAELLEPGLEPANPLDAWGTGADSHRVFVGSMLALAADPSVAAVAFGVDLVPEFDSDDDTLLAVTEAARGTAKPLAVLSNLHSAIDPVAAARIRAAGIPVLEGTRTGLLALGHLLEWRDALSMGLPDPAAFDAERRNRWLKRLASGPLSGADAFALLSDYGIGTVPAIAVDHRGAAIEAAESLGYPVVVKTDEPSIAHKSDVGGVVLDLTSAEEVADAFDGLARRLGKRALVAAMAPSGVELALGLVRDPQLGPLVVVAAGGVLVELLADRVVGLPPVDRDRARRLVDRLGARPLLEGVRGRPAGRPRGRRRRRGRRFDPGRGAERRAGRPRRKPAWLRAFRRGRARRPHHRTTARLEYAHSPRRADRPRSAPCTSCQKRTSRSRPAREPHRRGHSLRGAGRDEPRRAPARAQGQAP